MTTIYKCSDYEIRTITLNDYIEIPIYGDQREINIDRVNEIKEYQYNFYKSNGRFEFLSPPLIAVHKSNVENLLAKDNEKYDEVLFDGQHRLTAFKMLKEQYPNNNIFDKYYITIFCFYCSSDEDIHNKFININKSISATGIELQKNKNNYNSQKQINDALNNFLKNKTFKKNNQDIVKRITFESFYIIIFERELIINLELQELLMTNKIPTGKLLFFFSKLNHMLYDKIMNKANINIFSATSMAWRRELNKFIKLKQPFNPNILYFKYLHYKEYHRIISELINMIKIHYEN